MNRVISRSGEQQTNGEAFRDSGTSPAFDSRLITFICLYNVLDNPRKLLV